VVIWKETVPLASSTEIEVPATAVFVKAEAASFKTVDVWFKCNPNLNRHRRRLHFVADGEEFSGAGWDYIDTVFRTPVGPGFRIAYHVFDGGVVG
jgi:hypothetical protein